MRPTRARATAAGRLSTRLDDRNGHRAAGQGLRHNAAEMGTSAAVEEKAVRSHLLTLVSGGFVAGQMTT